MNRREFLRTLPLLSAPLIWACSSQSQAGRDAVNLYHMPDEGDVHHATWMAFGASAEIWGEKLLPEVRRNLASIALAIARFEPVNILVRPEELSLARGYFEQTTVHPINLIVAKMDDLWIRDTGAVFVQDVHGAKAAVNFNFNGWGNKQAHQQDAQVASMMAAHVNIPSLKTHLVLEGGGIEVDGQGTAIITESCVLNDNRNPNLTKSACEAELKRLLGINKVIWLTGIKGKDITDGHTYFYARFVRKGVVVAGFDPDSKSFDYEVTQRHLAQLKAATDANGQPLEIVAIEGPSRIRSQYANDDFAAGYINFYVCNGAVIMPEFGDNIADKRARDALHTLFPNREIVPVNIDGIAAGGGGIHCATQQQLR